MSMCEPREQTVLGRLKVVASTLMGLARTGLEESWPARLHVLDCLLDAR